MSFSKRARRSLVQRLDRLLGTAIRRLSRWQGKGWGESSTEEEVALILSKVPDPQIVIDVGGHVGNWTGALLARAKPRQVYIFEPSKKNQATLTARFQGRAEVTLIPKALSDADGVVPFYADAEGSAIASLHQRQLTHFNLDHREVDRVETVGAAGFLAERGIDRIDVLKLDIEGHEFSVLKAFPQDILRAIKVIQFEFGGCNIDSKTYFQDFWYLLGPAFVFYRISPFGLIRVWSYQELDEAFVTTNYLCVNQSVEV